MPAYRLGKLPPKHDPRTLRFERYAATLPPAPPSLDLSTHVFDWPMYGNDRLGDCTIAAAAHMTQLWSALSDDPTPLRPTEAEVERMYYTIGRQENPGQAKPDNGLVELDVLNYWRKHSLHRERVAAYVKVDHTNHEHVRQAIALFGGIYCGFGISDSAQLFREFDAAQPWTPEPGQDTEGHAVPGVGYDPATVTLITWGRKQLGTWAWWDQKVDEAYAIIPSSWHTAGRIPNGLDWATLQADLAAIAA